MSTGACSGSTSRRSDTPPCLTDGVTLEEDLAIVLRYFDEEQILPKTRLALEELLCG